MTTRVQRPEAKPHRVNIEIPYGGSGNGDLTFSADGRLNEAKADHRCLAGQDLRDTAGTVVTAAATLGGSILTYMGTLATAKSALDVAKATPTKNDKIDSLWFDTQEKKRPPAEPVVRIEIQAKPWHREYIFETGCLAADVAQSCATSLWSNQTVKVVDDTQKPADDAKKKDDDTDKSCTVKCEADKK